MILQAFSLYNQKAEVYNTPFFKRAAGEATRDVQTLVSDGQSMVSKYPEDYDLYHVGSYDDQTGVFEAFDSPRHIVKAIALRPNS